MNCERGMHVQIRKATENDLDSINQLFYELDTCSIEQQPEHFQRGERTKAYLCDIVNGKNTVFLLGVADNRIIGFSLLYLKEVNGPNLLVPCRYAYIQDFIVTKEYRNRGLGKQLMDASKEWAKINGAEYLRLSVIPKNVDGLRFYFKNGLSEQMITMECRLQ